MIIKGTTSKLSALRRRLLSIKYQRDSGNIKISPHKCFQLLPVIFMILDIDTKKISIH